MAREAADLGIERLARDLLLPERARIGRDLSARLAWLRALGAWPRLVAMPEALGATPIVAVYAGGALLGCAMAKESGLPGHRSAARRALDFVRARQLLPGRIPAALDPALALGGFSASPVLDLLRGDITGHALHALLAAH